MFSRIKRFFSRSHPTVFKKPLEDLIMNSNEIPEFLEILSKEILSQVASEGIFRKCGDQSLVNLMGEQAMKPNFTIPPQSNINDLTSFLKQWLRELPQPILTPSVVKQFYQNSELRSTKLILRNLNPINRKSLALLFNIMKEVINNSEVNLMNRSNLFICFTPSILQESQIIDYGTEFSFENFLDNAISLLNENGNDFANLEPFKLRTTSTSKYQSTPTTENQTANIFGEVSFAIAPQRNVNRTNRFPPKIRSNSTKSCPLLATLEVPAEKHRKHRKHRKSFHNHDNSPDNGNQSGQDPKEEEEIEYANENEEESSESNENQEKVNEDDDENESENEGEKVNEDDDDREKVKESEKEKNENERTQNNDEQETVNTNDNDVDEEKVIEENEEEKVQENQNQEDETKNGNGQEKVRQIEQANEHQSEENEEEAENEKIDENGQKVNEPENDKEDYEKVNQVDEDDDDREKVIENSNENEDENDDNEEESEKEKVVENEIDEEHKD